MSAITIKCISLKNYLQFRSATINFNSAPDRNIVVIEGPGGSGKSNLVSALTWCLFGATHQPFVAPEFRQLCNSKVFSKLKPSSSAEIRVDILLDTPKGQVKVSRSIAARRSSSGAELLDNRSMKFTAALHTKTGWRTIQSPKKMIAGFFPPAIRPISFVNAMNFQDMLAPHPFVRFRGDDAAPKYYSAGEVVCAGYQALLALRKIAGVAGPLVIDSPFQLLPTALRNGIVSMLETEFKDSQLILLVNWGECSKEMLSTLSPKISAMPYIKSSISGKASTICSAMPGVSARFTRRIP